MLSNVNLPQVVANTPIGGNVLGAMQAGQNYRQTALNNAILRAQQPYAGQQAYANALLTTQQANLAPYSAQMNALSNPTIWAAAANNPDLQKRLLSMIGSMPQAASGQQGNLPTMPQQSNGLVGHLINSLLGRNNSQSMPNQNPMASSSPTMQGNNPMASSGFQQNPGVQPTPGGNPLPTSTVGRVGQGGPLNGVNAITTAGAQKAGLDTTATTEAANQQNQWKDRQDTGNNSAIGAQNNLNYLNNLQNEYKKLGSLERGPLFGRGLEATPEANTFDSEANALADSVARAQQDGHITGADRSIYTGMKPNRTNTHGGFENIINYNKAMNQRLTELPAFNVAAQNSGLTPTQAQAVWSYYSRQEPFYDGKNDKVLNDNLGNWEDYLTPKKIQEALSPKQMKSTTDDLNSAQKVTTQSQPMSPASKALSNGTQWPNWNTQAEFKDWYSAQSPMVQQAYAKYLKDQGR